MRPEAHIVKAHLLSLWMVLRDATLKEQLVPGTLDKLHCFKIHPLFVRQLRKKDKSLRKLASAGEPQARGPERDAPKVPSCLTLGRVSGWAAALQRPPPHTHTLTD